MRIRLLGRTIAKALETWGLLQQCLQLLCGGIPEICGSSQMSEDEINHQANHGESIDTNLSESGRQSVEQDDEQGMDIGDHGLDLAREETDTNVQETPEATHTGAADASVRRVHFTERVSYVEVLSDDSSSVGCDSSSSSSSSEEEGVQAHGGDLHQGFDHGGEPKCGVSTSSTRTTQTVESCGDHLCTDHGCGSGVGDAHTITFIMRANVDPPSRSTKDSVGYDVCCPERVIIPAHCAVTIDLGFAIRLPKNCYATLHSRSGLAFLYNVTCFHGLIDPGMFQHLL